MSWFPTVYADLAYGGQMDQGDRLRVSTLFAEGDLKQIHDNQPLLYDEVTNGTATAVWTKSKGGVVMSAPANGDYAIRQSKNFFNYQAGKPMFIECTAADFAPTSGVTKRYGYFSSTTSAPYENNIDGLYIETVDNGEVTFKVTKDGVDVFSAAQSTWNINRLDGQGGRVENQPSDENSKITVSGDDWNQFHVLVIEFLYLGGTSARFGFVFNDRIHWCHNFNHAFNNTIDAPMIISPNQPVRYEIRSTGGSGTFDNICAQVSSEGSESEVGVPLFLSGGATNFDLQAVGTRYACVGFRLKSDYRDVTINTLFGGVLATTNDDLRWELLLNPTINNSGSITVNSIANSAVEELVADQAGNNSNDITDPGYVMAGDYGNGNDKTILPAASKLRAGSKIDGTMDEIWLAVTPLGANLDAFVGLNIDQLL